MQLQSYHKIWWKETVFYHIYIPSFQDSDGNGIRDFGGMTSHQDYFQSRGIKGTWLTHFLQSPKVDNGYDVIEYCGIDSVHGNLADFKTVMNEAHSRGVKIIMDMMVNHTSAESKWFQESSKSKNNHYRDYFIWKDQRDNWDYLFGENA